MSNNSQNIITVSFIIPALNEEKFIGETIQAIKSNSPKYPYQIIVVDNGSTDHTIEIVKAEDVILINNAGGTIASARNKGVWASEGKVLIFIDADVLVTSSWQNEIDQTISELLNNHLLVTGSRYSVLDEKAWLSRYWFYRMRYERSGYINGGHLITSRKLFLKINGFNEKFGTAEDYDFCKRAKKVGAEIVNNSKLHVLHLGYPTLINEFIARERWLGYEDFTSLYKTLTSKVALVAIVNIMLLCGLIVMTILNKNLLYLLA